MAAKDRTEPQDREDGDILGLLIEMVPLVFGPPAEEGDRLVSRATHHVRTLGRDHALHIAASGPRERGVDAHQAELQGIRAGFVVMHPATEPETSEREKVRLLDEAEEEALMFEIGP